MSLSRDGKLCLLALQPARLLVRTWQWLPGYLVDVSVLSTEAFSHCRCVGCDGVRMSGEPNNPVTVRTCPTASFCFLAPRLLHAGCRARSGSVLLLSSHGEMRAPFAPYQAAGLLPENAAGVRGCDQAAVRRAP